MASLELRNQTYRVVFMYDGRKYGYSLDTGDRQTAEGQRGGVEKTLMLLSQGALALPDGADVVAFVRNGGKIEAKNDPPAEPVTFGRFKEHYLQTHGNGAMEANSLATVAMHLGHFGRTLGERYPLEQLQLADLQRHVDPRAKKKYRGRPLSPARLKKEMASFRAAWNWAALTGLVRGSFPLKGLVYPKADEKPPFLTWQEIERKLPGLSEAEQAELWDCLFLTQPEIAQLLEHARRHATLPWV